MDGPKQYYLALRNSITYGYQADKHAAGLPPPAFNTGYGDVGWRQIVLKEYAETR